MSREDVEEYLREQLAGPTEIDAEDLSPPVCAWCGGELVGDVEVLIWDIPVHENEEVVYRYRYCSEECRKTDRNTALRGGEPHPNGEPERLDQEERELLTDGGVEQDDGGVDRRDGSRLEVEDPEHCKKCGGELPTGPCDATDAHGRPMIWSSALADWQTIVKCPDCWARERIEGLIGECQDRYAGNVPEVLADAVE